MVRALKTSLAAALALMALGTISPALAEAAEFHCSVLPCRFTVHPDGTGSAAHQVLVVQNETKTEGVGVTCERLKGSAWIAAKTSSELTLTELGYEACRPTGGVVEARIDMNGCDYLLAANGEVQIKCPSGKQIEVTVLSCVISIGEQRVKGAAYPTLGATPTREITLSLKATGITVSVSPSCGFNPNIVLTGEFFTANSILTGETEAGQMADAWFE